MLKQFEIKFNQSTGIENPFSALIIYNTEKNIPVDMKFIQFDTDKIDLQKIKICLHNCVQDECTRMFIKNVPEGVKPFSLKIYFCPDCKAPKNFRFIVYQGDLNSYPKVKDIEKYRTKNGIRLKELPTSNQSEIMKLGV